MMIKRCPKCNEPLYTQHIDKVDKAHCHHCGYEGKFSGGLPISNADRIRKMQDEELAKFLSEFSACQVCKYFNGELDRCGADNNFLCVKAYAEGIIGRWLKQPVED